jgi:predicted metal-dependent phosphoesterase TrpH
VIDLHLHTTASDGLLTPADLVQRLARASITAFSVTDHDTCAGLSEASGAAAASGLTFINGIEITTLADGREIHILGYGFDASDPELATFLDAQRRVRLARARELVRRLGDLGMPVDPGQLFSSNAEAAERSLGRPQVARLMVEAGHAANVNEAFERWLSRGRPAYVPREGPSPSEAVLRIRRAGGLASLAHPGLSACDDLIPGLVDEGLEGLEVWHTNHDASQALRYLGMASEHGLAPTGGSDFHGDEPGRGCGLGSIDVPEEAFARLMARLADRIGVWPV